MAHIFVFDAQKNIVFFDRKYAKYTLFFKDFFILLQNLYKNIIIIVYIYTKRWGGINEY